MNAIVLNLDHKEIGKKELPHQFNEDIRPDLIKRAVLALQLSRRQKYGASKEAGKRHSAYLSKRRRAYRGTYGIGQSRTPRKIMSRRGRRMIYVGAVAPQTVGGRRAHPPKAEKILEKKINKKERRKAVRSAISATMLNEFVKTRHILPENYPFIVVNDLENIEKTKEVKEVLLKLGLDNELRRCQEKIIRAGKGKLRGRKYKRKKGLLIVVSKSCILLKSARNIPGLDIVEVQKLNVENLAPGTVPGRLTLWTDASIERLEKESLFLK